MQSQAEQKYQKDKEKVKADFAKMLESKKPAQKEVFLENVAKVNDISARELAQYFLYMVITISDTDKITIKDQFNTNSTTRSYKQIENFEFTETGSTYSASQIGIDLVYASASYTISDNTENLTLIGIDSINGTGNAIDNIITGNTGDNILSGEAGNDTLDGGLGADTLIGGSGNDVFVVNDAVDTIIENIDEGFDTVNASISYTLADNVENLTLTGTTAIDGTGNALDNYITGNSGSNIIDGAVGADTMAGGTGNDSYYVDDSGDVVIETASAGTDTVYSSISYTLATNVENLALIGNNDINATGNTLNNIITGNAGNNTLDGGTGIDTLIGGAGDDTYLTDSTSEIITENTDEGTDTVVTSLTYANEGTDLVYSSVSYTLVDNVENLTLTGTSAINGVGNSLDNVITGNTANNILTGGLGNDTYYVDNEEDVVVENLDEGTDIINSSVTYTLSDKNNYQKKKKS